jgi:3-oxoacyl-[acyl-carrier protein] reductase
VNAARRLVEAVRPRMLERAHGPWQLRELAARGVAVAGFLDERVAQPFARMLAEAGATLHVIRPHPAFAREAEAFGAPLSSSHGPWSRLVLDATQIETPSQVAALFPDIRELVPRLPADGRLVVLARPAPIAAAAIEGFVRSAAKELGRRGATANLLVIDDGAEDRAAAVAKFLMSARSTFVTAQPLHVTTLAAWQPLVHALDRKVCVVTGAARGIGEAIARRLAEEGAHVVCVDRPDDEAALAKVAIAVRGSAFLADVRDEATPRRLAEHLDARHGGVDIVIHNAGITRDRTLGKMTAEEWGAVLDINFVAVTRITEALPLRDGGRVVVMSSVAGIAGNVGQTAYAASKAGLIGYARALAPSLAPRGITINAVAPGFIETRMTAAIPFAIREAGRRLSALGQGGHVVDVAEVVTFLSQPASAGITGATLRVCGGALIGA